MSRNRESLNSATCIVAVLFILVGTAIAPPSWSASVEVLKPSYLPPEAIVKTLGVSAGADGWVLRWEAEGVTHTVTVRTNDAANLLILTGDADDVSAVQDLVRRIDVAPRQIVIDARIVEVNESKSREIGLDWDRILREGLPRVSVQYRDDYAKSSRFDPSGHVFSRQDSDSRSLAATSSVNLGEALKLMDESGTGSVRNAPRVLTLNNRRATILDGQRVTYVTRYSSYSNLYVTDTMDAGLTLSVLPSLGESGYLTLDVRAELTSLAGEISGSPIKDGQIVENTVIVKDGETVLLGGFERTVKKSTKRRFPLLGHVLPFLFSREVTSESIIRSFVLLTPHVVDLAGVVDPANPEAVPTDRE